MKYKEENEFVCKQNTCNSLILARSTIAQSESKL